MIRMQSCPKFLSVFSAHLEHNSCRVCTILVRISVSGFPMISMYSSNQRIGVHPENFLQRQPNFPLLPHLAKAGFSPDNSQHLKSPNLTSTFGMYRDCQRFIPHAAEAWTQSFGHRNRYAHPWDRKDQRNQWMVSDNRIPHPIVAVIEHPKSIQNPWWIKLMWCFNRGGGLFGYPWASWLDPPAVGPHYLLWGFIFEPIEDKEYFSICRANPDIRSRRSI